MAVEPTCWLAAASGSGCSLPVCDLPS